MTADRNKHRAFANRGLALLTALLLLAPAARADSDRLYQVSSIDALLAGLYDGVAYVEEAITHGDFGLGTFDRLDGELILLDGEVFRAGADGKVVRMPADSRTPFIAVTDFAADLELPAPTGLSYAEFKQWLEQRLPSPNLVYGVRVDARFRDIRFRSVPPQQPPYPPLAEVAKQQSLFRQQGLTGTLVGFWCPQSMRGLNVPGFHLHLLSDDRRHAGHLLDFVLDEGRVQLDLTNVIQVHLPMNPSFLDTDLATTDEASLRAVEHGPGKPESGAASDHR